MYKIETSSSRLVLCVLVFLYFNEMYLEPLRI
jgi:hypothetical protein